MATNSNPFAALLNDTAAVQAALGSPAGVSALLSREAAALAALSIPTTDVWPLRNMGNAPRPIFAGIPNVEPAFHFPLEQGRFTDSGPGDANASLQIKLLDLNEKIQHYLSLNQLAIDGQLSDTPRAIKYAKDSVQFIQQIRSYINQGLAISSAIQGNLALLQSLEAQMTTMIDTNIVSLANLLNQICNWGLPDLPSLAASLGASGWHWNGFLFNLPAGFTFDSSIVAPNLNFSFSACTPLSGNLASAFASAPTLTDGSVTASVALPAPPLTGGSYGDPEQFCDPAYIAAMQATTKPVFNPHAVGLSASALPTPSSIISNYALPPETYQANVVAAVPDLNSATDDSSLRGLSIRFLTLGQIVASNFDSNLTAAWLFYLELNRTGRGGQWLSNMQAAYTEYITPSLVYLQQTAVPWNDVLGGTGVSDAPDAIPLLGEITPGGVLYQPIADNILWKLSYVEAALLGYARNTTWDDAADTAFLSAFTGVDADYVPTVVAATPMASTILGADTAAFPVTASYPQSIAGVLAEVISMAAAKIAVTPRFQSTRPQFRFTYDAFAQASVVDHFTQFWREFNANLVSFLSQDSYTTSFVVSYPAALDSAIDPLGDGSIYTTVARDAGTRNRNWTPGVDLLSIPSSPPATVPGTGPTDATNGWSGGNFDAAAFLTRPDIQALSLPTQIAMLRTNQSFGTLMTAKTNLQNAVAQAQRNAQAALATAGQPGWEIETNTVLPVPPGPTGLTLAFGRVDFNQTGYILDAQTVVIPADGSFLLSATLNWETDGPAGTRTLTLRRNDTVLATASTDSSSPTPFNVALSTLVSLNEGDDLQVVASHSLAAAQDLLVGSSFLGLTSSTAPNAAPATLSGSATTTFVSGGAFGAYTAVSLGSDGKLHPVNPTVRTQGVTPFVDGIALQASTGAGESISVAVMYGGIFSVTGVNWTIGGLLYVAADGTLTQDFSAVSELPWVVCIGKAVGAASLLYEPHLPSSTGN